MLLRLESIEAYPVFVTRPIENGGWDVDDNVGEWGERGWLEEIPDNIAEPFLAAEREFWAAHTELRRYLAAVRRDETSYQRIAEVALKQAQRGRRRHFRRARPTPKEA